MSVSKEIGDKIIESYGRLGSVHSVGKELGITHSMAHNYLRKHNLMKHFRYTDEEKFSIFKLYSDGFINGDGKLGGLCELLNRTKPNIVRFAKENGLTNNKRKCTTELKKKMSMMTIERLARDGHPRGFLNHNHTIESKSLISKKSRGYFDNETDEQNQSRIMKGLKTKHRNGTMYPQRKNVSWKAGWRNISGKDKYYRSRWEYNYALILQNMLENKTILSWEHEPDTFWFYAIKRGTRSYLPDFKVTRLNGEVYYVEVKGWMDSKSITKLKRMKKYYPDIRIELVDSNSYKSLTKIYKSSLKGWE